VLCEYGALCRARAARLLGVQPQSLGRLVPGLVALGAIGREVRVGRKEVRLVVLNEGARLLRQALEVMQQQEALFFRGVGAAERKLVLSIISYGAESVEWEAQRAWCPRLWR
jgi:DNA-binding MarR family transcriptional regulator